MATNQAAWLDAAGSPFVVREAPMPVPGDDEVVIRVHTVAINPTDAHRQAQGMAIPSYPHIIGCDGAGVVESVGSKVKHVKPGDRVIAQANEFMTQKSANAMFQQYACTEARAVCKIPDSLAFENACVLPLGLSTAVGAHFEKESLDLDWPCLTGDSKFAAQKEKHKDEVVIVWGGSSSVGACAIQLIVAAGYRVIATASSRNSSLLLECGAEATFDHSQEDCIDKICEWVEERKLECAGVCSVVIDPASFEKCGAIARRLPGRKWVATTLARGLMPEPDLGEGIRTSACLTITQDDLFEYIWKQWMPKALETGQLKCLPRAEVVGEGIESINHACDVMRKGVSGKKIVVKGI